MDHVLKITRGDQMEKVVIVQQGVK
jgi:hypothetical protein